MVIPKQQGDEDGLCGLYSILNAISYLYPDLNESHQASIFRTIARALRSWPEILWNGTTTSDVRHMLEAIVIPVVTVTMPFEKTEHISFKHFFEHLHSLVAPDHQVAIIGIEKPYEHWTVARTVTGANIVLQDSCQLHEIRREYSGLPGSGTQWQIDPACTFLIARS